MQKIYKFFNFHFVCLLDLKGRRGQFHRNDFQLRKWYSGIQRHCGQAADRCRFSVVPFHILLDGSALHCVESLYYALLYVCCVTSVKVFSWNAHFNLTCLLLQMKCCGGNSSSDWKGFDKDVNSVPDSCCVNATKDCGKGAMLDPVKVHQKVTPSSWCV